jgi:hypothetical protein
VVLTLTLMLMWSLVCVLDYMLCDRDLVIMMMRRDDLGSKP